MQIDKSIVYTHKSDVEEMIATHDASDTAHETRFKLFEKISDFGNDIIKKLALTTAITAITALETGSWFGQLLKMVLTASGVKYNIAQNGYVCLGSFFGGLIIQWGKSLHGWVTFPVSYTSARTIVTSHAGSEYMNVKVKEDSSLAGFTLDVADNSNIYQDAQWLAVGK